MYCSMANRNLKSSIIRFKHIPFGTRATIQNQIISFKVSRFILNYVFQQDLQNHAAKTLLKPYRIYHLLKPVKHNHSFIVVKIHWI